MKMSPLAILAVNVVIAASLAGAQEPSTVADALKRIRGIEIPHPCYPVERTVAESLRATFSPGATVREGTTSGEGIFRVHVVRGTPDTSSGWFRFSMQADGSGDLSASHAHLLYAALCRLREEWCARSPGEFLTGRTVPVHFPWLEGNDGFFAALPRLARGYDPEATIRELARLGCSHVSINVLASPAAYEEGVPGEIYPRFYSGSPDLDQFVSSELTNGLYPAEYLQANLDLLKKNAAIALAYGLTPGLTICSPRSMPDAFFAKYPYLRGARVDHPFRSYKPRYTATLSHPVVRWHYAQLMRAMMKEVPQLGYLYLWSNDSGSGFEFVSTLYPGRNGGAYLIREWKSDTAIARAAGENVLRYLRLLRDAAGETNPAFRVITSLGWFGAEKDVILNGLGDRLDLYVSPSDTSDGTRWPRMRALASKGSRLLGSTRAASNYVLGVPCPWLVQERLAASSTLGVRSVSVAMDPPSFSPWDINREIVLAYQTGSRDPVDTVVASTARRWCAAADVPSLTRVWHLTDQAVRSFPDVPLYGTSWAFPLYRHWVRPFVPDISAIPAPEREYYEQFMIATFNNPTLVDFGADALWTLIDGKHAASIVRTCDSLVWKPLDEALGLLKTSLTLQRQGVRGHDLFVDQYDRLRALRCYFRTLRNIAGWIAGERGYLGASSRDEQGAMLSALRSTIDDELKNSEELLHLWETARTAFMPVAAIGETYALYGTNFGTLLRKKIELMRKHRHDAPCIDPNFMWQTGRECPVPPAEYLSY